MRHFSFVLPIFFAGCASIPRKQLTAADHGILAVQFILKGQGFPNFLAHPATQVYWARVNAYGDLDLDHLIKTDAASGGYAYVLDVPPGRYAPYAAAFDEAGLRFMGRIDTEWRKTIVVDLKPDGYAFLGSVRLYMPWTGADQAILHFFQRFPFLIPPFKRETVEVDPTSMAIDKSALAEARSLRSALDALHGTLWIGRVESRLQSIGNPPEPLTRGTVIKKAVPVSETERFGYIDSLEWGDPHPAPGGLAWYAPKGRARILVVFMAPNVPGYKPMDRYLEDMRTAGIGDDAHTLYDVQVGSHTAKAARYTTILYPQATLPGRGGRVFKTETWLAPEPDGYYILQYRAEGRGFDNFYPAFRNFLRYLSFHKKKEKQEEQREPGLPGIP